jgi:hypothetical protein
MSFPASAYPGLLATLLTVQGVVGFIAWPLLSEVQPFGPDPAAGNFVLLLVPMFVAYAWPLRYQRADDRRLVLDGIVGRRKTPPEAVAALVRASWSSHSATCDAPAAASGLGDAARTASPPGSL